MSETMHLSSRMDRAVFACAALSILIVFACRQAAADVVTQAGSAFPNVPAILVSEGVTLADETTAEYLTIPAGANHVQFSLSRDIGDYLFTFGIFKVTDVATSPASDATYGNDAIGNATVVFTQWGGSPDIPGDTFDLNVNPGDVYGLFLLPNSGAPDYLADPSSYYPEIGYPESLAQIASGSTANPTPAPIFWSTKHQPMFGDDAANFGNMDQLLTFQTPTKDVLIWEDLSRDPSFANQQIITGLSIPPFLTVPGEIDFDDLVVSATYSFVPEPATTSAIVIAAAALHNRRRRSTI